MRCDSASVIVTIPRFASAFHSVVCQSFAIFNQKRSPAVLSVRTCRSGAFLAVLLLQIAEQILLVHAVGDEPGKAVNDSLLVLSVGDTEPLVVGGQHLDADLVGVQQFINVDGQQVLGLQRVGGVPDRGYCSGHSRYSGFLRPAADTGSDPYPDP